MPEQMQPQPRRSTRAHRAGMPLLRIVREPSPTRGARVTRPGQVGADLRAGRSFARPDSHTSRSLGGLLKEMSSRRASAPVGLDTEPRLRTRSLGPRLSRRARIAIISILLVQGIFGAVALWAVTSPAWRVRWVRVEGTQDQTLLAAIHRLPLTGCNVFHCDTGRVASQVDSLPLVASAQARVSYPDGLVVTVTARAPALLWNTGDQSVVVAGDGTVLGAVGSDPALTQNALPQVTDARAAAFGGRDPTPGARIDATLVRMAGQLRMGLAGALGEGWVLEYSGDSGLLATNSQGRTVIFGTPADAVSALGNAPGALGVAGSPTAGDVDRGTRIQLAVARQVIATLAKQGETATLIDVRWGAHPYYRLGS